MTSIKFGTDGWRAIIAEDYTFQNLARVSEATGKWVTQTGISSRVVIGYDTRFLSAEFAQLSARVIAAQGPEVILSNSFCPTPAVSLAAYEQKAVGVVITASHNPPSYNGFKIKAPFGGSASPSQITEVEECIPDSVNLDRLPDFEELTASGKIKSADFSSRYMEVIGERIDLDAVRSSGQKIVHDTMYGSGAGLLTSLLGDQVVPLRAERNPGFHGIAPEPVEKNLKEVSAAILSSGAMLGIANDGDADRVAMFDEKGGYVDSHQILSLLTKYMAVTRGMKGELVKTVSTTDMMRKQAERYGLQIHTTPIGFKYITEFILKGDVLVCGEESGGIAVKGHLAERDGIFIGLLVAEMCARRNKSLSELVQELFDEFGPHYCRRNDLHTTDARKKAMINFCKAGKLSEICGLKVVDTDQTDGIKHWLSDGSWLLVRPSGTEPVLRIYSEAQTPERALELVDEVSRLTETF